MSVGYGGKTLNDIEAGVPESPAPEAPSVPITTQPKAGLPEWLTKKVPAGETVEQYMDHPLNVLHSKGLAQALRGISAILGSLNYAIVDIVVGLFSFTRERPGTGEAVTSERRTVIPQ